MSRTTTRPPRGQVGPLLGTAVVAASLVLTLVAVVGAGRLGSLGVAAPLVVVAGLVFATVPRDRAFLALCFFLVALPVGDTGIGPLQVVQAAALLAAVGAVLVEISRGDLVALPWPVGLPISAMLVSAALSTHASPTPDASFRLDLALAVSALLVLALHSVVASPQRLRIIARLLVASSAIVGVTAARSVGDVEASAAGAIITGRAVGIFGQPNELGIFCAMMLPVGVALVLSEPSRRGRTLALVGTLAIGAGLTASLSRGAWVGGVVGLLAFWAFLPDRRRFVVPVTLIVVGLSGSLVVLSPVPFVAVINERIASAVSGSDNPYDERPEIYAEARRQIADAPVIGHGPGSFSVVGISLAQDGYYLQAEHAHNLWLTTWAENGLIGVLALAGLVAGLASRLLRGAAAVRDRLDERGPLLTSRMIAATTAGLVAVLTHGMVDYPLRNPVTSAATWFLVGLAVASARVGSTYARTLSSADGVGARVGPGTDPEHVR